MPPEVQEVKALRVKIDDCVQSTEKLLGDLQVSGSFSRALSLVKTKLEEAKMWGGKRLEEMNPDSYPTELADKANTVTSTPEQTIVPAQPAVPAPPNADTDIPQAPPVTSPDAS
jgi:hypothetical protein